MKTKVLEEVKHTFRPEFLNRVDEVVVFHPNSRREEIQEIVGLELEKVIREVKAQGMHLEGDGRSARLARTRRDGTRSSVLVHCVKSDANVRSRTSWRRSC